MGSITEEQIVKAQTSHPGEELHVLSNADTGVEIIVKAPNRGEWKRFRKLQEDEPNSAALEALVLGCVVVPSATEFAAVLAKRPGLADVFGNQLVEIGGINRSTTRRKI